MSGSRLRAWLIALGIFVLGVVVGGALMARVGMGALRRTISNTSPAPARPLERALTRVADNLSEELGLDPVAAARVRAHLTVTAAEVAQLRGETVRRLRATMEATLARIEADLPPEKRAEFRTRATQRFARFGWGVPGAGRGGGLDSAVEDETKAPKKKRTE